MENTLKKFLKTIHLNESTISTALGAVVVLVVGVLIFNYIKQTQTNPEITQEAISDEVQKIGDVEVEQTEEGKLVPKDLPESYEVKQGESLWKISQAQYGSGYNWTDIAKANNIQNPDYLEAGQEISLPKVEVKLLAQKEEVQNNQPEEQKTDVQQTDTISGDSYKAQAGDSLWKIAVRAYQDGYKWPEIAKTNNLANPDYLEVGQDLKLPR